MRLPVTGYIDSAFFDLALKQCEPCLTGKDKALALDLSSVEFGSPAGLVSLAALLRLMKGRGVAITVANYPSDPSACNYYCRMNFFRRIGAKTLCHARRADAETRFIEVTELNHPSVTQAVAGKLIGLLQRLPKGVEATEEARKSFIDACGELVSNTRHAHRSADTGQRPKALLQAQFYPKRELVRFCIADSGIGIRQSMEGKGDVHHPSHLDAIDAALALRNKGDTSDGKGLGLAALQSFVRKNGGILTIRSGDALKTQRGRVFTVTQALPNWDGTIVSLEIDVKKSSDLSDITKRLSK
jgi:anti-anti-sigma regulatory factor